MERTEATLTNDRDFQLERDMEKNHLCMLGKQPPSPHGFCERFAIHGAGAQVGGQADCGKGGGRRGRGRCLSAPVTRIRGRRWLPGVGTTRIRGSSQTWSGRGGIREVLSGGIVCAGQARGTGGAE